MHLAAYEQSKVSIYKNEYGKQRLFFRTKLPAPVDNANFFSFMTYTWLTDTILRARKSLTIDDLPPLSKYDGAEAATERWLTV